jgi:FHS family L-fucose permease-like MFS transporter
MLRKCIRVHIYVLDLFSEYSTSAEQDTKKEKTDKSQRFSNATRNILSAIAIALLIIAIFMPESITISFNGHDVPAKSFIIPACGLCTSIMWGGIFNLSVEGLGKYTEAASGIFMTMVVGGGIMPLIQETIANSVGPILSYWLVIAMLAYILFYALVGCKNVNTDIKVD